MDKKAVATELAVAAAKVVVVVATTAVVNHVASKVLDRFVHKNDAIEAPVTK